MSTTDAPPPTPGAQPAPASVAAGSGPVPTAVTPPAPDPASTPDSPARRLRHNADFRRFWFGEGVSLFGSQVTALALPLTAVLTLGAGPEELGVLRFLQLVPFLLFALPFGVWVDRSRRRPVLIGANLARLVLIGAVPLLATVDQLHLWALFAVTFGVGVATVLFDVCWMSYVPVLVRDPKQLVVANGKLGATSSAADAAGPSLGGALVGALTAPVTLALDALSYLVSTIALALIRTREPVPPAPARRRRLSAELGEGLRWVIGDGYLRAIALVGAACNFITAGVQSLFLVYVVSDQGLDPALLGLVFSVGAVGGIGGALVTSRLLARFRLGRVYVGSLAVAFAACALIPVVGGTPPVRVALYTALYFLMFGGVTTGNIVVLSLRQTITPRALLGRMNAAMRMLMVGFGAIGAPVGGVLGGAIGVRQALFAMSAAAIVMLVPILLSPVGRLRQMPPPAADPADAS
ncbi:MFS transporter [Micromonospora echinospora]|uniref:MFS transporter n=1 Tax=Micromonospora echinospora TaxID=1877 RepID=UPI0033EB7AD9